MDTERRSKSTIVEMGPTEEGEIRLKFADENLGKKGASPRVLDDSATTNTDSVLNCDSSARDSGSVWAWASSSYGDDVKKICTYFWY
ncbi:hypothetical protein ACFX2I_045133 [Malus domestica]